MTVLVSLGALLAGALMIISVKNESSSMGVKPAEALPVESISTWKQFIAPGGEFEVYMPELPQHLQNTLDIAKSEKKKKFEIYVTENRGGSVFMVYRISYPLDFKTSNQQLILEDEINDIIVTNPNNRLVSSVETEYQGYPARKFELDNKDYTILGLAFMVEKVVYIITYATIDDEVNLNEFQRFVESFQLLSQASE